MGLRASMGLGLLLAACRGASPLPPAPVASVASVAPAASAAPPAASSTELVAKPIPFPGVTGPAFLDYVVYEPGNDRVWVPVGNTGSVDVLDVATGKFDVVSGFKSAEREMRGKKRTMGPSAASVGDGVVYVGDRASNDVCVVDVKPLKLGACLTLQQATDGVVYVPSTKEVWVTTPRDQSLTVLDASSPRSLKAKFVVKLDGEPEGYAVDDRRGLFLTNLEDKDRTVVVDLKTHQTKAIWKPECGEAGPRGLVVDVARNFVIVACTDHVQVLDAGHDGALLGRLDTGAGLDNLDYLVSKSLVYAAAGRAARLTIARIDDQGRLTIVATAPTAEGARNAVADAHGNAYVADPNAARMLVLPFTP